MELKEPEKQILDDFEHKVTGKIDKYGDEPDFPKLENYGITRMDLDDYLFDNKENRWASRIQGGRNQGP